MNFFTKIFFLSSNFIKYKHKEKEFINDNVLSNMFSDAQTEAIKQFLKDAI